ncbi:Lrp/AsnC family transcriptional regulator [Halobacillus aidingensis]|uniref:Lrp/AsnC family transcriptional regulator, leucine-responsive regulatory protein n=1 Tax=Halobacillus aidingensis TaxID=240303 RepID=A0A1H0GI66_HALAD|nr:Lrp/AsnC family transcriptional regulator [Halobacillus aidingensis]SDO06439.1 Lrp/AsnC family transcriptional regulator, leucine-responsive regulatory protein [Halobacillus aidingensis]
MLDHTDLKIIQELTHNSRMTMKELGDKVHLTGQAAATRVAKLEEQGVVEGYTVKVNKKKIGYAVHAFITVMTQSTSHHPYLNFVETQTKHVENHYKISGEGCYMLECRFVSHEQLDQFLVDLNRHANYKLSIVINHQSK